MLVGLFYICLICVVDGVCVALVFVFDVFLVVIYLELWGFCLLFALLICVVVCLCLFGLFGCLVVEIVCSVDASSNCFAICICFILFNWIYAYLLAAGSCIYCDCFFCCLVCIFVTIHFVCYFG